MRIVFILLRLLLFYLLFRFFYKVIYLIINFIWKHRNKYGKDNAVNKGHQQTNDTASKYKNVIDAEFEEIK